MYKKTLARIFLLFLAFFASACASTMRSATVQPLVVLLTDFGDKDHYVGALKGAIYRADPSARVDQITNQISKFDVVEGAYTLAQAAREYPNGAIFVAVVDPGVGSSRKAIAIKTGGDKIFVGPDNGLLAIAAEEAGIIEIREISNEILMRQGEISKTFHGRDVFGPVAGHLAAGTPFEELGPRISRIVELPIEEARTNNGRLSGHVIHIDGYGNLITNVPISMVKRLGLRPGAWAKLTIGEEKVKAQYVRTYSDVGIGTPLFLDNGGFAEAAVNRGSLAGNIGAAQGMPVIIERWNEPEPSE